MNDKDIREFWNPILKGVQQAERQMTVAIQGKLDADMCKNIVRDLAMVLMELRAKLKEGE